MAYQRIALARSAKARYKRTYEHLFVQGWDTSTKQDVGALLDTGRGWGVLGKASRVSDLEKELSKHLVVRITNATTALDLCVVHLRRPIVADGVNDCGDYAGLAGMMLRAEMEPLLRPGSEWSGRQFSSPRRRTGCRR